MWSPWKTHWALALVKGIREPHDEKMLYLKCRWMVNKMDAKALFRATTKTEVLVFFRNFEMLYRKCRRPNQERLARKIPVARVAAAPSSSSSYTYDLLASWMIPRVYFSSHKYIMTAMLIVLLRFRIVFCPISGWIYVLIGFVRKPITYNTNHSSWEIYWPKALHTK